MPFVKELRNRTSQISERTAFFRERLRKWFAAAAIIGLFTGLAVAGIHYVVYELLWLNLLKDSSNLWLWFFLPLGGIFLSGLIVHSFSRKSPEHGTEEFVEAFHENEGRMNERSSATKIAAAISTIGLGGSAGLEGPSIQVGATFASWLQKHARRFGFEDGDRRWMVLAGAAAGVAAVFKAPLTGIVFALEIPYRDDLAHQATIPALIASTTSYFVYVSIVGTTPLFNVPHFFTLDYKILLYAGLLGIVTGLAARVFVMFFHWAGDLMESRIPNPYVRAIVGGSIVGFTGIVSISIFAAPLSLGIGYEGIHRVLAGNVGLAALVALFILKAIATTSTLRSGGVGGIFVPLVFLGALVGSSFGHILQSTKIVFPIMGMAGFLAAGYNVPLAAAAFVAETTGSPGFIIPGLIAAAVSYVFSGRLGLSTHQRYGRQTVIRRAQNRTVGEAMTTDVITVKPELPLSEFVSDYVVRFRHPAFPVANKSFLLGVIDISDVRRTPEEKRSAILVREIMNKTLTTVFPDESLTRALDEMNEYGVNLLPVVNRSRPDEIVGIISITDIIRAERLSSEVKQSLR